MKILLIHQFFLKEGAPGGQRFNDMVKIWSDNGCQIEVITSDVNYLSSEVSYGRIIEKENYYNNVTVWRCSGVRGINDNFYKRLHSYLKYLLLGLYVLFFKVKKDYNIIIASSPPISIAFLGLIAKLVKKCPLIFEVRDLWPEAIKDLKIINNKIVLKALYKFEGYIYKISDKIIVLSPSFKIDITKRYKEIGNKIKCIENGVLTSRMPAKNTPIDVDIRKFNIVYSGAMGVANNVLSVLKSAKALKKISNIKFILIGDGMDKKMLEEYKFKNDLSNVEFHPSMKYEGALSVISKCDLGIVVFKPLSVFEKNLSNKMFDYLFCGLPVLMASKGEGSNFIQNYHLGELVNINEVSSWVEKILFLKDNPNLRVTYSNNGKKLIKEKYNRKDLAIKYFKLFRDLNTN